MGNGTVDTISAVHVDFLHALYMNGNAPEHPGSLRSLRAQFQQSSSEWHGLLGSKVPRLDGSQFSCDQYHELETKADQ
ncbi:uncharacterized protein N7458_008020 [Penicillium daleae]|uniref:Uncharacterized protein n=1 Tax=Penicillium daleae TaxID=63821 RepID=A0AAD6G1E9_9EURO|nr:uncharacterized protein N7458_008020 [Penicillium daleae]KAJ5444148.1 hypothetical protein N7458_008020 [Penicillium daleae]